MDKHTFLLRKDYLKDSIIYLERIQEVFLAEDSPVMKEANQFIEKAILQVKACDLYLDLETGKPEDFEED